ncbi:MAG: M48 family metallopeptidase [Leptospiraceae bacterium]|nr:M48 family metallopeptidase [Leptospiraceae bacterium]
MARKKEVQYTLLMDGLQIQVVQKSMKSVRFTVYPPDGRIRVAAPLHLSRNQVRGYVDGRLPWIHKQKEIIARIPAEPRLAYTQGEQHEYLGRRVRLDFTGPVSAAGQQWSGLVDGNRLLVPVSPDLDEGQRKAAVERIYRTTLRDFMKDRISHWERIMSVKVHAFGVRKMKTLWGSCNIRAKRVWLNLDLAKRKKECIESILVHEMVHLKERLHNARFYAFMDQYLPDWKEREKELRGRSGRY